MSAVTADRDEIGRFVSAMFRHADQGGYVSLRTFEHQRGAKPVEIQAVVLNGEGLAPVVAQAAGAANRAARHTKPCVFAPPVATFRTAIRAAEADLMNGLALVAECDDQPAEAVARLRDILSGVTVIVESGGTWTDPATGEALPKLHAYCRLSKPTRTPDEHARLKRANKILSALVGSDPSAVTAVHPLRWPGSVHRKGTPKLCTIAERNDDFELDLVDAEERLERAARLALEHATGAEAERLRLALGGDYGARRDARGGKHDPDALPGPEAGPTQAAVEAKVSPFRAVNDAALAAPERWVSDLFGAAAHKDNRNFWRVSSAGLGRDREEDISISPEGIVDFGEHDMGDARQGRRTAIDLVIEHGDVADAIAAARWLADRLGIQIEIAGMATNKAKPSQQVGFADGKWDAAGGPGVWASEDAATGISHDALALEMGGVWTDARYVSLFGRWLFFDGSRWLRDELLRHMTRTREFLRSKAAALVAWAEMRGDADLLEACKKASKKMLDAPTVAAVEKLARSNPGQVASVDQWDADPWLLGTPGGTVDLRTGELRPARAEEYITKLAKVTPAAPGTHTSSFDAFLERIFRHDPELVPYMYRVFGYALTGLTTEHVLVFWWGEGGNGKGVLLNTAAHVMGEYATVAAPDLLLETRNERHPTELAMLQGARLVIASEVSRDKAWAEQKLKSLTGGDKITAHYMRQDDFTFIPQFLLVIAGNHKPAFRTVDRAIRRRIQLVPFLQNIPEAERDKDLENKLKEEAPAILRKFIDGCLDWKQQGLNPPASVREASESYLAGEDVLGQWLDERCDQSNRWAEALTGELFADWSTWREANGFKPQSGVAFSKSLDERGFTRGKTSAGDRCFHGLALIGKQGPDRKWEGAL